MKHPDCSRCKKSACTIKYPATTDINVTDVKANILDLGLSRDATGRKIETCNLCTSPESRIVLDTNMGFDRYETHLINIILSRVEKNKAIKTIDANSINTDTTRYDLLLTNGTGIKNPTKALLIEVDESQHFKLDGKVDGELREKIFLNKYSENNPHILRIRVSEDGKTDSGEKCLPVLVKSGNYICIKNEAKYKSNISIISNYVDSFFNTNSKKYKIAYINMSDNIGLRDMSNIEISYNGGEKNIKKLIPKWENIYKHTTEERKPFVKELVNETLNTKIESLVKNTKNLKITQEKNPDKKSIQCIGKKCTNKTRSVTACCPDHKK